MAKRYIFLLITLIILTTSCGKPYEITIGNYCTADTIFVGYVNLDNHDTTNIQIIPHSAKKIFDSYPAIGKYNWNSDYRVHINYIINTAGDSINFDPNTIGKWGGGTNPYIYLLSLKIDESSFQ